MAKSLEGSVTHMRDGTQTLAPFAHLLFCVKAPDQCSENTGPDLVEMKEGMRSQLDRINRDINRSIIPVSDAKGRDLWSVDTTRGDCEDFALTKRKRLIQDGWPARALRIAIARTTTGEGHAVLVVKTSDGDLVLDNRIEKIKDWRKTDLRWVMIQSGEKPRVWLALDRSQPSVQYSAATE